MRMKELRWSVVKDIIFNIGTVIFIRVLKVFNMDTALAPKWADDYPALAPNVLMITQIPMTIVLLPDWSLLVCVVGE